MFIETLFVMWLLSEHVAQSHVEMGFLMLLAVDPIRAEKRQLREPLQKCSINI